MSKLVSIIIPVYNRANVFAQSLRSVFDQDYKDIEVIVVDDGSIESGVERVAREEVDVIYVKQENKGAPAARNKGFEMSKGEYVIFWDADVIAQPDMISKMVDRLETHPDASFCYSHHVMGGHKMPASKFDIEALKQCNYIHTNSLIRRDSFVGWDEDVKRFQDWDMWLSMVEKGYTGILVDEYLFDVITTGGTISDWLPSFAYKKPWKYLPWWSEKVKKYEQAREVIRKKHKI